MLEQILDWSGGVSNTRYCERTSESNEDRNCLRNPLGRQMYSLTCWVGYRSPEPFTGQFLFGEDLHKIMSFVKILKGSHK